MNSVCLISLPSPFLIDEKVFPPLGILYLSTALKYQGCDVAVHDGAIADIPSGFSHYAISATTPQFPLAVKALHHLRATGKSRVIIGGPHPTVDATSCKQAGFDGVVMGPGEVSLKLAIDYGCDLISTPFNTYIKPDRSAIDIKSYKYEIDGRPATSVMTSRGCPYNCAFCCKSTGKVVLHPAEMVIKELEELHDMYGYDGFQFFDDIFIADRHRLYHILDAIQPWGIKWRGFVRADMLVKGNIEMVEKMRDSGCVEVGMGIESGSGTILKTIGKGETIGTIKHAIRLLQKYKIRVKGFFIVGLPGESHETIAETSHFVHDMQLDGADFSIYTPYKGSPIYEHKEKFDIGWNRLDLEHLWYKGTPGRYESQVFTSTLNELQITEYRNELERSFKCLNA